MQARNRQIALGGRRRPDRDGAIGRDHVRRARVGVGVHRDALDAELAAGADDPERDLAAVGDEEPADHRDPARASASRGTPVSPSWPSGDTRRAPSDRAAVIGIASSIGPSPHVANQRLRGGDGLRPAVRTRGRTRRPRRRARARARRRGRGRSPSRARRGEARAGQEQLARRRRARSSRARTAR